MSGLKRAVMVAMTVGVSVSWMDFDAAKAESDGKVWQYREAEGTAGVGRKSAGLVFGVPETDNVQVQAGCESGFVRDGKSISLVLGADVGAMKDGDKIKVRFSGGRFKHTVDGIVHGTQAEVGVSGAHVQLAYDDKLWQAMQERDGLEYQVPGYQVANLNLRGGASTFQRFVNTCGRYARRHQGSSETSNTTSSNDGSQVIRVAGNSGAGSKNINEKEAFESAKELNTIEGWEAFLNSFSTGFRADLARAYVKRLAGQGGAAPAASGQSKTATSSSESKSTDDRKMPILDTFEARAGRAPWRTTRYEMDEGNSNVKAAAVKGNGVELLFHCEGTRLAGILRESGRNLYPNFDRRVKQGLEAKRSGRPEGEPVPIPFEFSNGRTYSVGAHVMEMNGEISLTRRSGGGGFKADGSMLADLMSEDFVTISAPPFVASLQLKNSRPALCSLIKSCGASAKGCGSTTKEYVPKKVYKKKKKKERSCRKGGGSCSRNSQCCSGKCCLNDFEECEGWYGKCT